jgi:hypothetical protein
MNHFKMFVIASCAGVAASVITNMFFVQAHASSETLNEAIRTGQCQVSTSAPMMSGSYQCFGNAVMVGVWGNNLYCSEIRVSCN